MRSDAQRSAESKYRKEKVRQHTLKFYPADADVYENIYVPAGDERAVHVEHVAYFQSREAF